MLDRAISSHRHDGWHSLVFLLSDIPIRPPQVAPQPQMTARTIELFICTPRANSTTNIPIVTGTNIVAAALNMDMTVAISSHYHFETRIHTIPERKPPAAPEIAAAGPPTRPPTTPPAALTRPHS